MTNEDAKVFLDNLKICINEHPVVADWLVEIADRKTEPQFDKDINVRSKDEPQFDYCPRCGMRILVDKPKDEPQPSKIIEAYAKGYKDGADAVNAMPQTERSSE